VADNRLRYCPRATRKTVFALFFSTKGPRQQALDWPPGDVNHLLSEHQAKEERKTRAIRVEDNPPGRRALFVDVRPRFSGIPRPGLEPASGTETAARNALRTTRDKRSRREESARF